MTKLFNVSTLKKIARIFGLLYIWLIVTPVVTLLFLLLLPFSGYEDAVNETFKRFDIDEAFKIKNLKRLFY